MFVFSCDDDFYPAEVEGCTDSNATNFNEYATINDGSCYTKYMMLVDGVIDVNEINSLGTTSFSGNLEYNNKGSFPHLFDNSNIEMTHSDEFGNILGLLHIDDFTNGEFNLILVDNSSGETYNSINTSLEPLTIDDKVNNFNIELLDNDNYNITHFISDGEFNLIFHINDVDGNPMENMDVFLQYTLDCDSDLEGSIFYCDEEQSENINENRAITKFEFRVCQESEINIKIQLLDDTIIEETTDYYEANFNGYQYTFSSPSNLVTAGIQIFKYSIEFLDNHNSCDNYLSDNYPNPFN